MHKFKVGQLVTYDSPRHTSAPSGAYEIIQLVPEEGSGPHYRIKSKAEPHARVAHERDLARYDVER